MFALSAFFLFALIASTSYSQPVSGNINVGPGQTFTSLTGTGAAGFFNRVNTSGLSGNVTVRITGDITESGSVSLNQWSTGSGFTITITPSAATQRTLLANNSTSEIIFDGADNVIIDGRFNGSGRYLRFQNSNTSGSTFRFINDATGNTIRYCTIEGTNASTTSGVIEFLTTTGSSGNDNNTITNCLIKDYGGTTPQIMVYSNGTTSTAARNNSGITISSNEIYNFYVSGQPCSGVKLDGGTTDWTISGNSFYQTSTRNTNTATTYILIYVNTSNANNLTISGNYLGGGAANCGGTAFTLSGNASHAWYGIYFANAGSSTASNVNGNFIQNISLSTSPSSNGVIHFAGMIIGAGDVNVGTTSGNTIGNTTSNGNISLTINGNRTNIVCRGIDSRIDNTVSNNTIGSVTIDGSNNNLIRFEALVSQTGTSGTKTFSNNTVGSTTQSNSIYANDPTMDIELTGFYSTSTGGTLNVTGNTIGNMTSTATSTSSYVRGIYQNGGALVLNANNNTIVELLGAGSNTSRAPQNSPSIAILTGSSATGQNANNNVIRGIRGNGNASNYITAFGHYNPNGGGTFSRNRIYDITNSSTSGSPKIWVINSYWGSWNFWNNQITVTNGEASDFVQGNPPTNGNSRDNMQVDNNAPGYLATDIAADRNVIPVKTELPPEQLDATNDVEIKGIHDEAEFTATYYYNSVYVGGSQASGTSNSWCYDRPLLSWATPTTMRNNIFYNARTGTGKNYAFGNEVGLTNWNSNTSNYNVYITVSSSVVAAWQSNDYNMNSWRLNSGADLQTWYTTTSDIPAATFFQNISTGDLGIRTNTAAAWIVSGKGIAINGVNIDFDGTARVTAISGGTTDIGSDEFAATPPNNPTATVDNAPGSGVISTYTLWSRTLMVIEWGTGGSSYPSSLAIRYYSGINPSGVLGGGYSNSYWQVTPTGSLTGAKYDITQYFGDNETYSISTPSSNTRLASYGGSSWEVYISGTGPWQSELTWVGLTVKTRQLYTFPVFALTDGSNPLPVELCSFNASVLKRDVQLSWTTCSEVNNMGFDVERRNFNSAGNDYGQWTKIGFVEGHGTSNQQNEYKLSDYKLVTGKYQYRLKQIDYNGNYEYHNLTSPADVIIGTPGVADLFQNYPNPSNPTSKVDYQIPFDGKVSLKVYDITGQEVATLFDGVQQSGYYTAVFNGSGLASGVYFYRLITSSADGQSFNKTMKLILVK